MLHHPPNPAQTVILLLLLACILGLYLYGTTHPRKSHWPWNPWRTVCFVIGMGLVALAVILPLIGHRAMLTTHMWQHLLLGMMAPIGIVFGAPLSLSWRSLPISGARRLAALVNSRPIRFLSHPLPALFLNTGGMFVLYLTPMFLLSLSNTGLHYFIHFHFLVAGCLFTWAIAGPDPAPDRPPFALRLFVLFLSIALHANLSKAMYIHLLPAGTGLTDTEIQAAAMLMYYGGDLSELLLLILLFAGSLNSKRRIPRPALLRPSQDS